jgi:uncharacterized membrane protein YjjP (DUF1212 family)
MTTLNERARFITDFARRLHLAGVSAARLEGAVQSTAKAIGVDCEIWSSPTGILLSIGEPDDASSQQTRVLRLDPAEPNLSDLVALDRIAEDVIVGKVDVIEASNRLRALDRPPPPHHAMWSIVAFGLAAAAVAGLLRTSWLDIAVAGALGLVIGGIAVPARSRPHLSAASEAIAATVGDRATFEQPFQYPEGIRAVVVNGFVALRDGQRGTRMTGKSLRPAG